MTRGGAVVARRAHNPKVVGSSPAPATKHKALKTNMFSGPFLFLKALVPSACAHPVPILRLTINL